MRSVVIRILVLLALVGCRRPPTSPSHDPTPADELRAFAAFLEEVHPEPFRFVDPVDFRRTVDAQAATLAALDVPDQFQVGRAFQRVLAEIGDFHLQLALPAYQPDYPEPLSLVPVSVIRIGEQVYVDGSLEGWPVGTQLLELDGVESGAMWDELQALASADGKRSDVRRAMVERDFAKYFHLRFGMAPDYDVRIRLPDGTVEAHTLTGLRAEAYRSVAIERHSLRASPPSPTPLLPRLEPVDDAVAWLRLPSFSNPDLEAYRRQVDALFTEIDGIETLVVDVRGNPGGYRGHGVGVLAHFVDAPYRQWRSLGARVARIPKDYRDTVEPLLDGQATIRSSFPDAKGPGPLERTDDPLADHLTPRDPHFGGTVVLFTDGHTNSAANTFALTLRRELPDLTILGHEVGGDCDRHVGNFPVAYPTAAGVTVVVSLMSVEHEPVEGCEPGRGLRPDIEVVRTLDDYVLGIDPFWSAFDRWRAAR